MTRHGRYEKYLYGTRIPILRLRCRSCRRTHAVIPSFSLPGTSLGTTEVEAFIVGRYTGESRRKAGGMLTARGVPEEYLRRIEKLVCAAIHQAKALFGDSAPLIGQPYGWLKEATAADPRPIFTVNTWSVAGGYGAVFCSLAAGAGRRTRSSGIGFSHDSTSVGVAAPVLHSG